MHHGQTKGGEETRNT